MLVSSSIVVALYVADRCCTCAPRAAPSSPFGAADNKCKTYLLPIDIVQYTIGIYYTALIRSREEILYLRHQKVRNRSVSEGGFCLYVGASTEYSGRI
jgi:hypothetical protein